MPGCQALLILTRAPVGTDSTSMLADGANSVYSAPWLFAFPSLLLVMLTVSMALIGDGLRDALDPNSKAGGNA